MSRAEEVKFVKLLDKITASYYGNRFFREEDWYYDIGSIDFRIRRSLNHP